MTTNPEDFRNQYKVPDVSKKIHISPIEKLTRAAANLSLMGIDFPYQEYIDDYQKNKGSKLEMVAEFNLEKYIYLKETFPYLDIDFDGRLKAEYNFYEKMLDKTIKSKSNSYIPPYDLFAFRIVTNSATFHVDMIRQTINEKTGIKEFVMEDNTTVSGKQKSFKIIPGDTIFLKDGSSHEVTKDNIVTISNALYLKVDNQLHSLKNVSVKKVDSETLIKEGYEIRESLKKFYQENNFQHVEEDYENKNREKDYIAHPKIPKLKIKNCLPQKKEEIKRFIKDKEKHIYIPSEKAKQNLIQLHLKKQQGYKTVKSKPHVASYQSLHNTYYSLEYNMYMEDQIRTHQMHEIAENSETIGHGNYKKMSPNDLDAEAKLPMILAFHSTPYRYEIKNKAYAIKQLYGLTLKEFSKIQAKLEQEFEASDPYKNREK